MHLWKLHQLFFLGFLALLMLACRVPSGKNEETLPAPESRPPLISSEEEGDADRISPFLGIGYAAVDLGDQPIAAVTKAIQVLRIIPGTAAEEMGIQPLDIILRYDEKTFNHTPQDEIAQVFKNYVSKQKQVGEAFHLEIFRHETLVGGKRNAQAIPAEQLDTEALPDLINQQNPGEVLRLTIKKQPVLKKITAILGTQPNRLTSDPPENASLFPQYEEYSDPYIELSQKLIAELELEEAYEDLLERYEKDEWWDDGFRLKRIRYIHRDPLKLPKVAKDAAHALESQVNADTQNFPNLLQAAAQLLDEPPLREAANVPQAPVSYKPDAHFAYIVAIVTQARDFRSRALQNLSEADLEFLYETLLSLPEKLAEHYYLESNTDPAIFKNYQRVIELSHQIDYAALFHSAKILSHLANPQWLDLLSKVLSNWHPPPSQNVPNVYGDLRFAGSTAVGTIVIGGKGATRYESEIAIVIDLGGDDLYLNNAGAARHPQMPVSVLIDLSGNDTYSATHSVAQGSGMLGSGILIDQKGNDTYIGIQLSQGIGIMGTGTLIDRQGADQYHGQEFNQGFALWGSGILLDLQGQDSYKSHLFAQGVGATKGIGLLLDVAGADHYYATGKYKSTYNVEGLFHGSSQGYGIGLRSYASGGVGMLLDLAGKDVFQAGNFSQGGGYYFGLGILNNGGNEDDLYIGSRYSQGFSAHSAAGILMDEGGDDRYLGKIGAMQAAAWDIGSAALIDTSGDDTYDTLGWTFGQGAAENNGFALFIDMAGRDTYLTGKRNPPQNQYHGGASFSFFIDNGEQEDLYFQENGTNAQIKVEGEYGIFIDLNEPIEKALENDTWQSLILPRVLLQEEAETE